jgi:hypothetical protein
VAEGRYTRIKSKFWNDEKVVTWCDDTKLLALYLVSSPHSNMIGCYYLPLGYVCEDLGWDIDRLRSSLQNLIINVFIKYDEIAKVVYLPTYLMHNPIENENQAKSAAKQVAELPKTQLIQDLKLYVKALRKPFLNPLLKQLGEPVTVTVTVTVTETEDIRPPFMSKKQENYFDQFWSVYPRKKSKGQAERTWVKLNPNEQLLASMIATIERAKTSVEWTSGGGQFIPYPSTWLNAKGWEDEIEEQRDTRFDDLPEV